MIRALAALTPVQPADRVPAEVRIQIQMCLTFCLLSIVDYKSRAGNKVLARGLKGKVKVRPLPCGGAHDVRGCHRGFLGSWSAPHVSTKYSDRERAGGQSMMTYNTMFDQHYG